MYFLLEMGIFHCYVSWAEGNYCINESIFELYKKTPPPPKKKKTDLNFPLFHQKLNGTLPTDP